MGCSSTGSKEGRAMSMAKGATNGRLWSTQDTPQRTTEEGGQRDLFNRKGADNDSTRTGARAGTFAPTVG